MRRQLLVIGLLIAGLTTLVIEVGRISYRVGFDEGRQFERKYAQAPPEPAATEAGQQRAWGMESHWRVLSPEESALRDAHPDWLWSAVDDGTFRVSAGAFKGYCPRCRSGHVVEFGRSGEFIQSYCDVCNFRFLVEREPRRKGRR